MADQCDFIRPGDSRWGELLGQVPHDFYQTATYAEFAARYEGGKPVAFYSKRSGTVCLVPLLLRRIPGPLGSERGWCDAASPYGYPGVLRTGGSSAEDLDRMLEDFKRTAAEQNVISAFIRLHPLQAIPAEILAKHGVVRDHGETVYIDLTRSDEDMWRETRSDLRRALKRLIVAGYYPRMNDWRHLDEFAQIYRQTMKSVGARAWYLFSNAYFQDFKISLGPAAHLCTVMSPDDRIAAAGLFTLTNGIAQYHLGGTADEFASAGPSKLMLDFVRSWFKRMGARRLHLGGGVGCRKDSLFYFKAGFSKSRAQFRTFRVIADRGKYDEAIRQNLRYGSSADTEYFPAYRRPH